MKIKIGRHINFIGPYQVAEILCFWAKDITNQYGMKSKPAWVHNFGEFLATGKFGSETDEQRTEQKAPVPVSFDEIVLNKEPKTWFYKLLEWIHSKRHRTIKIRIDPWDTWNMDAALAMIILPMLKQLKATKHGAPFVDDEDVPERLRSINAPPVNKETGETDELFFRRWDWCLDELIWAFGSYNNDDLDEVYFSTKGEIIKKPVKFDEDGNPTEWVDSDVKAENFTFDQKLYEKFCARQRHAFSLFGKYYQSLWD